MLQSFDTPTNSIDTAGHVAKLRALLLQQKLDAFLVPRADEHQAEYVPPSAERLKWLTGFSGSAGLAVITRNAAALFVDGRYTVQVRAESNPDLFEFKGLARDHAGQWLKDKLPKGSVVGFDPWLHTGASIGALEDALAAKGIKLKPLARNLVDVAWGAARPRPPMMPIEPHPLKFAGRSAADKIADVQTQLKAQDRDAVILTLPDSICWLFNIRGADVPHNPVVLAFAIVPDSGKPELFVAREKVTKAAREHLDQVARIAEPAALTKRIAELKAKRKRVVLDTTTAAFALSRALGAALVNGPDPCIGAKAIKNTIEIKGARAAHIRDGAAVTNFLAWFDHAASRNGLDEIAAVTQLEAYRAETGALKELSFDTISGSGPNGAIVHYRVNDRTNRDLREGELFLLDSGAQYQDGTTDITRTIAVGTPSREMRERFTLVLKGHIAIATAKFPKGTRGIDLDPFARRALWAHGLDYDHGTGHGVGSYLSVHEGPQSISRGGMAELKPGMICSNEPGYYKDGHYGIRIENLVLVTEPADVPGGDKPMMGFETLTLVPIDRRLIAKDLLSADEISWLDTYHARVHDTIAPLVDEATRSWLGAATRRL